MLAAKFKLNYLHVQSDKKMEYLSNEAFQSKVDVQTKKCKRELKGTKNSISTTRITEKYRTTIDNVLPSSVLRSLVFHQLMLLASESRIIQELEL